MSGFMVNVILPSADPAAVSYVTSTLNSTYNIYMVAASVPAATKEGILMFTRLSAQVYLESSDFEQLGLLVPELLKEYGKRSNSTTDHYN